MFAVSVPGTLLLSLGVVAFERSGQYVAAGAVGVVGVLAMCCVFYPPGDRRLRLAEQWAAGHTVDRAKALEGSYAYGRGAITRGVGGNAVGCAAVLVAVSAIAGATESRLVQYGVVGASVGISAALIGGHSFVEPALRPARAALAGDTAIGDCLPRSRPTFAAWSNLSMSAVACLFAMGGAMLAALFETASEVPLLWVVIGCGLTLAFAVPIFVGGGSAPSMQPIRDLATGTERVAAGDYNQRLPVVQDDDLGALTASFNRMQAGLAERQRLQAAFGTYVDPTLASRLLEQGDDVFTGERREVTVMFVDVRDFTPFAEANTAEDTVARLNALFEIVVPAVVDAGGHVNKFLGDGALAVFGAPTIWGIMPIPR
jgi:adenylate cyclase